MVRNIEGVIPGIVNVLTVGKKRLEMAVKLGTKAVDHGQM